MLILTRVFHALHRFGIASAAEVGLSIGISQTSAAHALALLKRDHKARKVGGGRSTRWELVEGATAPIDGRGMAIGSALARDLAPTQPARKQAQARAKLHARKPKVARHKLPLSAQAWRDLLDALGRAPHSKLVLADDQPEF